MSRNHPKRDAPSQIPTPSSSSSSSSASSSSSYSNSRHRDNETRTSGSQPKWNRNRINNNNNNNNNNRAGMPRVNISNSRATPTPQRVPLEEYDNQQIDLTCVQSIVGTCPFMCPEKERSQRERLRDLAIIERLEGIPGKSSASLAVKKFCRTISMKEVQASDLRPLSVLEDTLNYLLKLLNSSAYSFLVLHDFIFDRTRSIRQDLSMQSIKNEQVIYMYEKMVRFHITSHYKLRRCEGDSTTLSSIHHLNMEQLTKCLASLYNLYDINRTSDSVFENEAEFRSLYVLLHLDSHSQSAGESLSLWFSQLSSLIIRSKEMCFARRVLRFYRIGNFCRFFHTIASEATYLQIYVIEPYIIEVRAHAIACINSSGYKLHPYPLTSLSKILKIKESDLETFCNACGLQTTQDDMGNKVLPTKQTGFSHPRRGFQCNDFSWLELLEKDAPV